MNSPPRTLVFDLDGTLIHSAPDLAAALNLVLEEAGRDTVTLHQVTQMIGDGIAVLVERGFAATGGPADDQTARLDRFHHHYGKATADLTELYPGVLETLQALAAAGHRMALCTNKPAQATASVLEAFGLARFFEAVAGGDTFAVRKPSPGHLLGTLQMMDADPEHAVMIGDSPNDVQVALNAAIPAIAVSYGYRRVPAEEMGADILIDHFHEVPAALQQLGLASA
ncbi:MAG: phosphoglycolate phosphatase [Alphaproteobacteria bacterium]|nr:phosphoglycolate phosphatase [Alphaproteobacteria bacterium]